MSDHQQIETDVAVIGGGPGGYAAAFMAADLGLNVVLVDKEKNPGGVCLYRGCIPSKALLHIAKLISEAEAASEWGIYFQKPDIDLDKVRTWKENVVKKLTDGLGQLTKQRKIRYLQGTAFFLDSHRINVTADDGSKSTIKCDSAIVATGSKSAWIPGFPPPSERIWNSKTALELKQIPKKLLVVGGGYIGLELGSVYAALGSEVTVVEMLPGILPGADRDLVSVLQKSLDKKFAQLLLETTVSEMKELKNGVKVSFQPKGEQPFQETFDAVLVSVGRKPVTQGLGLENTGVQISEKGFILTDEQRKTTDLAIYAIGDVAGEPMLAHKATHEGRTAAEAIAGRKVAFEPAAIPAVVFTDPEVAWCGLTEQEARNFGRGVEIYRFPWAASGRATTLGRDDGLTKLILEEKTGRVLGVGIVGPGVGELIAEGVLAVEMGALAQDLELSIHPHPTLSETLMETASMLYGTTTHLYRPKRKPKNK